VSRRAAGSLHSCRRCSMADVFAVSAAVAAAAIFVRNRPALVWRQRCTGANCWDACFRPWRSRASAPGLSSWSSQSKRPQNKNPSCRNCTTRLSSETTPTALQEGFEGRLQVTARTLKEGSECSLQMTARTLKDAMAAEKNAIRELEEAARIMQEDWKVTAMEVVGQPKNLPLNSHIFIGEQARGWQQLGANSLGSNSGANPVARPHQRLTLKDRPIPIGHVVRLVMNSEDRVEQIKAAPWSGPPPLLRNATSTTVWQQRHERLNRDEQRKHAFHPPKAVRAAFDNKSQQERRLPPIPARKRQAPFTAAGHANGLSLTEKNGCGTSVCKNSLPLAEITQVTTSRMTWTSLLQGCEVCIQECKFERHGVAVPVPTDNTKQFHRAW